MAYNRCALCNSTNSHEITIHIEEYRHGLQFVPDLVDPSSLICEECYNEIYPEETKTWEDQVDEEADYEESWNE